MIDLNLGSIIWAGVDYYRITGIGLRDRVKHWFNDPSVSCEQPGFAGLPFEPAKMMQYTGVKRGALSVMTSYQGDLVQVSGQPVMLKEALELEGARASRVDWQVTVAYGGDPSEGVREVARRAAEFEGAKEGRRRKLVQYEGYGDGNTLYIGSRTSERFIRVYDKEKHGGVTGGLRIEIETKGATAAEGWRRLQAGARAEEIALAEARACLEPLYLHMEGGLLEAADCIRVPFERQPDNERSLRWLHKVVRPYIAALEAKGVARAAIEATLWPGD